MNGFSCSRRAILAIVVSAALLAAGAAAAAHSHSGPGDHSTCPFCITSQFGWTAVVEPIQTCPSADVICDLAAPCSLPLRAALPVTRPARAPPAVL